MKKILIYFNLLFLLSISTYAQKETYNWFYGSGQGITWNRIQDFPGVPIHAPNTTVTLQGIPSRYESIGVHPNRFNTYRAGAIQLGPDYRMYLIMAPPLENYKKTQTSVLYLFDQPNDPVDTGVYALKDLSPGMGQGTQGNSGARLGLPTFASSFFVNAQGTLTQCLGEEAVYTINTSSNRIEVDFDEGNGPFIMNNVSELRHTFKKPGNYLVKVRPLNVLGHPIRDEQKAIYTTVYSCYLPVNHNIVNIEY